MGAKFRVGLEIRIESGFAAGSDSAFCDRGSGCTPFVDSSSKVFEDTEFGRGSFIVR